MADYTDNALRASIKALDEVIQPALNPADPLAGEQLRLVSGFLKFFRSRLDRRQGRQSFELKHYLAMAQDVAAVVRQTSIGEAIQLDTVIANALPISRQSDATLAELVGATTALASSLSEAARRASAADRELGRSIELLIVRSSKQWVDMQRAWFMPHGFELHPDEVPDLLDVLSPGKRQKDRKQRPITRKETS